MNIAIFSKEFYFFHQKWNPDHQRQNPDMGYKENNLDTEVRTSESQSSPNMESDVNGDMDIL